MKVSESQLNDVQRNAIEKSKRGQSSSLVWKEQRKDRITASKCYEANSKTNSLAQEKHVPVSKFAHSIIHGEASISQLEAIKWGIDHEQQASEAFFCN